MLGGVLGYAWSSAWPGVTPGPLALLGAGAVRAATTQGPNHRGPCHGADRPRPGVHLALLVAVGTAALVARTMVPRSIYDARLSDEVVEARRTLRDQPPR